MALSLCGAFPRRDRTAWSKLRRDAAHSKGSRRSTRAAIDAPGDSSENDDEDEDENAEAADFGGSEEGWRKRRSEASALSIHRTTADAPAWAHSDAAALLPASEAVEAVERVEAVELVEAPVVVVLL